MYGWENLTLVRHTEDKKGREKTLCNLPMGLYKWILKIVKKVLEYHDHLHPGERRRIRRAVYYYLFLEKMV